MGAPPRASDGRLPDPLRQRARAIAQRVASGEREESDRDATWPIRTMTALREDQLTGLLVPTEAGGLGGGFRELVIVCEEIAKEHPSAALAFGMHCVGTACIVARATPEQTERYLRPIARGEHVTTLALSERAAGVHFYLPNLQARIDDDHFLLDGEKAFVTSAGHVDSYVVSTAALERSDDPGLFNLLVVDHDTRGVEVGPAWAGLGMRGNSARSVHFENARVPSVNLLGHEGDQAWYVFEIVAPYFLAAMAATYLGVAARAVDEAAGHIRERVHDSLGRSLADAAPVQHALASAWMRVEQGRRLLEHAARTADAGDPGAAVALMSAKASLDEIVVEVTDEAMTLGGGSAFGENGLLAMLMRDARASKIMSPTTSLLRSWVGRSLLGLPILSME